MAISEERRRARRRKQRRQAILIICILLLVVALIVTGLFFGIRGLVRLFRRGENTAAPVSVTETAAPRTPNAILEEATRLAAGYDYDKAIELIQSFPGFENYEKLSEAIGQFEEAKTQLLPANLNEVTHVFFHTLIADNAKAFDGEYTEDGYNQYMTTISEFNAMLRIMHERGYVLVNLDDMAKVVTAEDGTTKMEPLEILLPPGKKPMVMSQDDVSYYRYMLGDGFATRLVIGDDGYPTNEYTNEDGTVVRGDYDLVPILEKFIKEHPDFSYRGARATLAITGYDGVLGYRTCPSGEGYDEAEIEKARAVAERMRELGWVFASHSWGHQLYGSISTEKLRTDAEKWDSEVKPILGDTDIIIYAHGEDIAGIEAYDSSNEKYNILREYGFRYFCNVDAHTYWVQLTDEYLRQGRRNLDGYRMYYNPEMLTDLFDVSDVWDAERPTPVPPI
ncbi:MAG: polysaccharide deacetylase [Ruminococcaceae bacterium]|nr:polysaccharide deacetylase [Oscillospiraceae bacterium]